nr:DNA repair protein RadA [Solirubrobacterales bacterium]
AQRGVALGGGDARTPIACFGELGLTGELRSIAHPDRRLSEAAKFGLTEVVTPETAPTLRQALRTVLPAAAPRRAAA